MYSYNSLNTAINTNKTRHSFHITRLENENNKNISHFQIFYKIHPGIVSRNIK